MSAVISKRGIDDRNRKKEIFQVKVSIGKEIAHPNKAAHYIRWINFYFHPQGEKFLYQVKKAGLAAYGQSVGGHDASTIFTHHEAKLNFKTNKSGTIKAASYCNIHGL